MCRPRRRLDLVELLLPGGFKPRVCYIHIFGLEFKAQEVSAEKIRGNSSGSATHEAIEDSTALRSAVSYQLFDKLDRLLCRVYHCPVGAFGTPGESGNAPDDVSCTLGREAVILCRENHKFVLVGVKVAGTDTLIPYERVAHGQCFLKQREVEPMTAPIAEPVHAAVRGENPVELPEQLAVEWGTDGKVAQGCHFFLVMGRARKVGRVANDCIYPPSDICMMQSSASPQMIEFIFSIFLSINFCFWKIINNFAIA